MLNIINDIKYFLNNNSDIKTIFENCKVHTKQLIDACNKYLHTIYDATKTRDIIRSSYSNAICSSLMRSASCLLRSASILSSS
jgi:hypothetical protein